MVNAAGGRVDYWDIVARALRVTWRSKPLWVFGFLVSLGGGNVLNWSERVGAPVRDYLTMHVGVLVLAVVLVVVVWLALFVISIISRGALVGGTRDADAGARVALGDAWACGVRRFWGLLGLLAFGVAAFLVVSVILAVPLVLPIAAGAPGIAISIVIGALLAIPYLAFLVVLALTIIYAERAYVLAGVGFQESLAIGWSLMRRCLGQSLLVWLIALLSDVIFFLALVVILAVIAVPFVLIGLASAVVGLILGIPVGIVFVCVATGAYGTYKYALWTIAYRELAGSVAGPPVPLACGGEGGASVETAADELPERRSW